MPISAARRKAVATLSHSRTDTPKPKMVSGETEEKVIAKIREIAPNVDAIVSFYEDNMDNLLADYDVLVVVEPDPIETSLLAEHYGVDGSAGFYTITREGGSIGLTPEEE